MFAEGFGRMGAAVERIADVMQRGEIRHAQSVENDTKRTAAIEREVANQAKIADSVARAAAAAEDHTATGRAMVANHERDSDMMARAMGEEFAEDPVVKASREADEERKIIGGGYEVKS